MIGEGDLGKNSEELLHRRILAHQQARSVAGVEAVPQFTDPGEGVAALGGTLQHGRELFQREGFGQVVTRTGAHGFHG